MTNDEFKRIEERYTLWWNSRPKFIKTLQDHCAYKVMYGNKVKQLEAMGYVAPSESMKAELIEFYKREPINKWFTIFCYSHQRQFFNVSPTIHVMPYGEKIAPVSLHAVWEFFCELCDTDEIYICCRYTFNGNDINGWNLITRVKDK
jgi:hypothetical protein